MKIEARKSKTGGACSWWDWNTAGVRSKKSVGRERKWGITRSAFQKRTLRTSHHEKNNGKYGALRYAATVWVVPCTWFVLSLHGTKNQEHTPLLWRPNDTVQPWVTQSVTFLRIFYVESVCRISTKYRVENFLYGIFSTILTQGRWAINGVRRMVE